MPNATPTYLRPRRDDAQARRNRRNGAYAHPLSLRRREIYSNAAGDPTARQFAAMLPLDRGIEDCSTNERIARLPRKLTEEGGGPFSNEAPDDLCCYAPWGLAFFHCDYKYSIGPDPAGPPRRRSTSSTHARQVLRCASSI